MYRSITSPTKISFWISRGDGGDVGVNGSMPSAIRTDGERTEEVWEEAKAEESEEKEKEN